jgi:hypothetical protein
LFAACQSAVATEVEAAVSALVIKLFICELL